MSEGIGKCGLRVFVDWVENGQDWDDEEDAHGAVEGAHVMGQARRGSVKRNTDRRFAEFTKGHILRVSGSIYWAIARAVCLAGMAVLLMMVSHLPAFGFADSLANDEAAGRYLEDGLSETGAVSTVVGIILDYRASDTFGESVVLFLLAANVITLARRKSGDGFGGRTDQRERREYERNEEGDIVLKRVARLLVPLIPILGLYVVLNGHLSLGGRFSGGAAMGVGSILYANTSECRQIHRFFSFETFTVVSSSVLAVYALSRGYSSSTGTNRLESGIPLGRPGNISSAGLILPLNICVGLVMAGTMYCFCPLFREGEV